MEIKYASMMKLVHIPHLKCGGEILIGSNPITRTNKAHTAIIHNYKSK